MKGIKKASAVNRILEIITIIEEKLKNVKL